MAFKLFTPRTDNRFPLLIHHLNLSGQTDCSSVGSSSCCQWEPDQLQDLGQVTGLHLYCIDPAPQIETAGLDLHEI